MKMGERIAILLGALLLTLVAFNLIATQAVDLLKFGKEAGYEITVEASAPPSSPGLQLHNVFGRKLFGALMLLILSVLLFGLGASLKNLFSGKRPTGRPHQTPSP